MENNMLKQRSREKPNRSLPSHIDPGWRAETFLLSVQEIRNEGEGDDYIYQTPVFKK